MLMQCLVGTDGKKGISWNSLRFSSLRFEGFDSEVRQVVIEYNKLYTIEKTRTNRRYFYVQVVHALTFPIIDTKRFNLDFLHCTFDGILRQTRIFHSLSWRSA